MMIIYAARIFFWGYRRCCALKNGSNFFHTCNAIVMSGSHVHHHHYALFMRSYSVGFFFSTPHIADTSCNFALLFIYRLILAFCAMVGVVVFVPRFVHWTHTRAQITPEYHHYDIAFYFMELPRTAA